MKILTALFLCLCLSASPALAQFVGSGSTINPLTPIPNITCIPNPFTGGAWDWCNTLQQQIDVYNHYAGMLNDIERMKIEMQQYMRYPQKVQGYINTDLSHIESIVSQAKGLSFLSHSIDQDIASNVPDWNPGYSLSDLNLYLEQNLENSIRGVLKSASAQNADIARDTDTVEAIKDAAASSTSAIQTGQMTVQLLSVMYAQMVRQQQATGLQMSQEAAFDLQQVAQRHVERQASLATAREQQKRLYPVPPTLSKDQVNQILNSSPKVP